MLVMDGFATEPITLDTTEMTVTAPAGSTVGDVQTFLHQRGYVMLITSVPNSYPE